MTLTQEELDILPQKLDTKNVCKNRLKALGQVCPFYKDGGCSVYSVRPCQCRLFHCGRMSPGDRKLESIPDIRELMLKNPEYMEFKTRMDEEAIRWGNEHGWNWRNKVVNGNKVVL